MPDPEYGPYRGNEAPCPECGGSGYDPLDGGQCDRCGGTGSVPVSR